MIAIFRSKIYRVKSAEKILGECGKYHGAFLDTSGEVKIGKNGIWEKDAVVAESNLEHFSIEEEKFSLALDESILTKN